MQKIHMVDLHTQYLKIKPEIDQAIQEVIDSTAFINGQSVRDFCTDFADYLQVGHVIPCANGTDALQIALMALDLKPGDEVITVPFTFVATAEVIALLNLKPVFVDVDPHTFTMSVDQLEAAITAKTKCILPVHLYGQCSHMEPIMVIAEKHGIPVVEDNAQAIGAEYIDAGGSVTKGGTIGDFGCTSFFPSKNLGAYGDGGALYTNNADLAEKAQIICNHGSKIKYYNDWIGVNSRLDSIQAAVLRVKLRYLDKYISARQAAADYYDRQFREVDILEIPARASYSSHVFHQYTLKILHGRDQIHQDLIEKGIPSMIYYPVPLHLQKAYQGFGYKKGDFPVTEDLGEKVLSLPMHTELDQEQLSYITHQLIEILTVK